MNSNSNTPNPAGSNPCAAFLEEVTHLILGELPTERVAAVEAHCAACATCRAERELLAKSAELIRKEAPSIAPLLQLSNARQQALLAAAGASSGGGGGSLTRVHGFWNARRLTAAAAAILTVCVTGNWMWRRYDVGVDRCQMTAEAELLASRGAATHLDARAGDTSTHPVGSGAFAYGPGISSADSLATLNPERSPVETPAADAFADETRDSELATKLSDAVAAGDRDAAKNAVKELQKSGESIAPATIAALSIELAQNDQAEVAVELLEQLPRLEELDDKTADRMRRVAGYVRGQLPKDGAEIDVAALRALGYLGGEEAAEDPEQTVFAADLEKVVGEARALATPSPTGNTPSLNMKHKDGSELEPSELALLEGARRSARLVRSELPPGSPTTNPPAPAAGAIELDLLERAVNAANFNYPGTTYDFPDVATSTASALAKLKQVMLAPDQSIDSLGATPGLSTPLSALSSPSESAGPIPLPVVSGLGQSQSIFFNDAAAEASWKVSHPTGAGDPFLVDGADGDIRGSTTNYFDAAVLTAPLFGDALVDSYFCGTWAADGAASPDPRLAQVVLARLALAAPSDLARIEGELQRAAATGRTIDVDAVVKLFLDKLSPRQGETPRDMFFRWFGDNAVIPTRIDARSTFGMDVDTASYNLARGYLAKGALPPKAAVRTEEFVNAFKQGLAAPSAIGAEGAVGDVFALSTELAPSPFGEGKHLLRVGLKAREIDRNARKPAALTFVIDVSGSMEEGGRLELVKQSLRLLAAQLDERDTVAIVVFSENARIALPPTRGSNHGAIVAALDVLRPEQSTNAGAGLRLGYDLAIAQLRPDADNRVVLCSDGVANAGVTDPDQLTARIRECKSKRICLTTVGVGMNNVNDALLEQLAREGDGNCHYVDGLAEAKELFVDKLTGTLSTVARDAKIQVEFEPTAVRAFRQIGYENRAIAHADFRNDRVDAGEVGAGHEVVALYELDLATDSTGSLATGPLATVRCRYEDPRTTTVREQARICFAAEAGSSAGAMPPRWRLDAAVAEFAELLRQSVHARDGSFGAIERLAEPLVAELAGDADVPEFVALVKQAARLPDLLPRRTELTRCVDELKKVRVWQSEWRQVDPPQQQTNSELMNQLEEQNKKLEQALRDALTNASKVR
ncbi:MAG: DUF3520 domain-containing protein [Planctomycetes bacterium]|nr:DUF3520 domain-containing protein [Planctomycetota bacterium]